jgi:O-antigen ligase
MTRVRIATSKQRRSRLVRNKLWPVIVIFTIGVAIISGGANQLLSSQIFASAILLVATLIFLSSAGENPLEHFKHKSLFVVGAFLVLGAMVFQLMPFQPCKVSPVVWARGSSVTIDPDWTLRGITSFCAAIAAVFIGIVLSASAQQRRWALIAFQICMLVVIAHAAFDWLIALRAPVDSAAPDIVRLNGNLVSANTFASLMILSLCVGLGQWLDNWNHRFHPVRRFSVALAIIVTIASIFALAATFSRVGVALGIIAILIVLGSLPRFDKKVVWIWLFGSVVVGAFLVVGTQTLGVKFREVDLAASILNRLPEWQSALALFETRPCYGWGVGTFSLAIQPIQLPPTNNMTLISSTPHNAILLILSETGLIGLAAWAVLCVGVLRLIVASLRAPLNPSLTRVAIFVATIAILIHNLADYSLAVPAVCVCVCFMLGLALGTSGKDRGAL